MQLRDYLHIKRIKIAQFARDLHATRSYITNICNGKLRPGPRLAKDIERLTEGLVTADELLNEVAQEE